jgi:hypothetical protein
MTALWAFVHCLIHARTATHAALTARLGTWSARLTALRPHGAPAAGTIIVPPCTTATLRRTGEWSPLLTATAVAHLLASTAAPREALLGSSSIARLHRATTAGTIVIPHRTVAHPLAIAVAPRGAPTVSACIVWLHRAAAARTFIVPHRTAFTMVRTGVWSTLLAAAGIAHPLAIAAAQREALTGTAPLVRLHRATVARALIVPVRSIVDRALLRSSVLAMPAGAVMRTLRGRKIAGQPSARHQCDHGDGVRVHDSTPQR